MKSFSALFIFLLLIWVTPAYAEGPVKPSAKEKCPVCGMFVAKYPEWVAQITFADGTMVFFDGAKDFFKYTFDIKKYSRGKHVKDIKEAYVTEYYRLELIDATKAFFVIGSDVYGPMGHELIPFEKEEEAAVFMKDHQGKKILQFDQVNSSVVQKLD